MRMCKHAYGVREMLCSLFGWSNNFELSDIFSFMLLYVLSARCGGSEISLKSEWFPKRAT